MFWLRNKKIKFMLHTLNLSPGPPYMFILQLIVSIFVCVMPQFMTLFLSINLFVRVDALRPSHLYFCHVGTGLKNC